MTTAHREPMAEERIVRVFVSSTFRDMGAERDELGKWIFPALRKLCESRGVTWGEVDLRWGITNEQKAEVLPICLAEIRRCRPYVIGLLGERYGWVPDALDPALVNQEPWLAEHAGRSVTELEILHGVLNDPAMAEHTFFYLRDPAYSEERTADQFREIATPSDIAQHGPQEAERLAAERSAKLAALKDRIRSSGLPVHEGYHDPRALGELVLADLSEVIERLYPEGSEPDPLSREAAEHEAFAASRAGVYVGRPEYFSRLDAHGAGDGPPLVVLGESGSGKSALLANWGLRYRADHPDEPVILQFTGASPASTDWASMVRRIIGELKRQLDLAIEIPDKPDALRMAFANALHMAAAKGRVVLVIDALNQLDDREGALDLAWLPPVIPAKVRLVLSTLPGRSLAETEKRSWPTLPVEPLDAEERERLIVEYLTSFKKALDKGPRQLIASSPQCANPLYLRALLEELRLWGDHDSLPGEIRRYLKAPSIDSLYKLILRRYEQDYERDRPGLVAEAMSLMWAARRGLTEAELLDLLGTEDGPLPQAFWAPLYLAIEQSLVSRSGLLGFFHNYLRQAVERHYLTSEQQEQAAHLRLADYFERRGSDPRKVDELPWQLARAKGWDRLYHILADLTFFERLWTLSETDAKSYWSELEGNSTFRKASCYAEALSDAEASPEALHHVATLFADTGHPERAAAIWEVLTARSSGTPFSHEVFKGAFAVALLKGGRIADGLRVLEEQARYTALDFSLLQVQCATLGNLGMALCHMGESDQALRLFQHQETLARRIKDAASLRMAVSNQATILARQQRFDEALGASLEAERLCREAGDMSGLAASLGNQGLVFLQWHRHAAANEKLDQANEIFETLGDTSNVATSLGARAAMLRDLGDLGEALTLLEKQKRLCKTSGDVLGEATASANIATLLHELGRSDEAMAVAQQVIEIANAQGFREVEQYMSEWAEQWRIQH